MGAHPQIDLLRCAGCRQLAVPPAYVCRGCGSVGLENCRIPGEGTIYTFTVIRVAPEAHQEDAPYPIAVVDLDGNLRLTARLEGAKEGEIRIGQRVRFTHQDGKGHWFRLAP
jgi:uncharacterized protein